MLKNYLKVTLRNLRRNKAYSILNITGLALGIACSVIIMLYLQSDLTYDKHYEKHDRIYRLSSLFEIAGKPDNFALSSAAIAPLMASEYPEIENYTRLSYFLGNMFLKHGEDQFYEDQVFFADSTYFDIFNHEFIYGDLTNCLREINGIVLTKSLSEKIFGATNPIGELLSTDNGSFKVTAVIADLPDNTHLKFTALIAYTVLTQGNPEKQEELIQNLWNVSVYSYLLLPENYDPQSLKDKFPDFYEKYMAAVGEQLSGKFTIALEKLSDIHFDSAMQYDAPSGNRAYIYAFVFIGLFILLLACINYMNMATARSTSRAKEVGMRKVMGASKKQLMLQFLGESIIMAFLSLIIGLSIVELILSLTPFNSLVNKNLSLNFSENPLTITGSLLITLFIGIVSGLYPAVYLSSIRPIRALKGAFKSGRTGLILRRVLVSFQFMISIGVVASTLLMLNQMDYIRNKDLGFDKENILLIPIQDTILRNKIPSIKNELLSNPNILAASTANNIPGLTVGRNVWSVEGENGMEKQIFNLMVVAEDYIETMGIEVVEGRGFDRKLYSTTNKSFIINEAAAKSMGWDDPIGKRMEWGFDEAGNASFKGRVVGVVKDFNIASLHKNIEPLAMALQLNPSGNLHLKLKGENIPETMAFIKEKWAEFDPNRPFDYSFLDEDLQELYEDDERQSKLISIFAYICILISCLGLLGLASFSTEQRTKEIGVRKVLGASVWQIIFLLFRDIVLLTIIAALIAAPITYLLINNWLQDFAFQVSLNYWTFIIVPVLAIVVAFIIVSFHSFKAAMANPVHALRYE